MATNLKKFSIWCNCKHVSVEVFSCKRWE